MTREEAKAKCDAQLGRALGAIRAITRKDWNVAVVLFSPTNPEETMIVTDQPGLNTDQVCEKLIAGLSATKSNHQKVRTIVNIPPGNPGN